MYIVMFLFETETSRLLYLACQPSYPVRQLPSQRLKRARYVLDIGRSNRKGEQPLSLSMSYAKVNR